MSRVVKKNKKIKVLVVGNFQYVSARLRVFNGLQSLKACLFTSRGFINILQFYCTLLYI